MDIATLIGLIAGVSMMLWAILSSAELKTFVDFPSVLIVIGGSVCASLISFPLRNLLGVAKVIKNCVFARPPDTIKLIADMVRFAEVARRDGILSLENMTAEIKDPFIVSGIQMAVDGTDPDLIETIMTTELEAIESRHGEGKALLDALGKYAPAFGMIGTLIGLVIMLKNMEDPATIGPAMAVALLTTLYGAWISNLFALPLSDKLALRSREELLAKMIVIKGVLAIQSGDNPRIVEQKLKTFLPSRERVKVTAKAAA
ncbi:MAG TPA: MotA/TolQ/ExbB proton channel family protein [Phycisphaerae bacterium]|nr:MotA/TolQ/ExbB proton channel family protein [Phycisphaerae bacterium]HNU46163.1 MotA/TolQ/ExbB proton channel family protein [Phycisphaerae bacterium]